MWALTVRMKPHCVQVADTPAGTDPLVGVALPVGWEQRHQLRVQVPILHRAYWAVHAVYWRMILNPFEESLYVCVGQLPILVRHMRLHARKGALDGSPESDMLPVSKGCPKCASGLQERRSWPGGVLSLAFQPDFGDCTVAIFASALFNASGSSSASTSLGGCKEPLGLLRIVWLWFGLLAHGPTVSAVLSVIKNEDEGQLRVGPRQPRPSPPVPGFLIRGSLASEPFRR